MSQTSWYDDLTPVDIFLRQLATRALDRSMASTFVDAFVRGGCVTLTGKVHSPAMKTDAEQVVRSVPGIATVINRVEVEMAAESSADRTPRVPR